MDLTAKGWQKKGEVNMYAFGQEWHKPNDIITISETYSNWKFNRLNYNEQYKVIRSDDWYIYELEKADGDRLIVKMDHRYFDFIANTNNQKQTFEDGDICLIKWAGNGLSSEDEVVVIKVQSGWLKVIKWPEEDTTGFGFNEVFTIPHDQVAMVLWNRYKEQENKIVAGKEVEFNPSLETRKDGKNQMELVDTGFPNALMMLGEVMTWAAKNKGYKVNDWKNLPDPLFNLIGAASRHRCKRLAGQEYDEESGLPHLAHEAFNVLAQLELLMLGKLK